MVDKLITGAAAYRERRGKTEWLLVRISDDSGWELPKSRVKRGESSVSAIIRALREDSGIRARILEEAGRATVSEQKNIFYLARELAIDGATVQETRWVPYSDARRSLTLEREKRILRQANQVLRLWRKKKEN